MGCTNSKQHRNSSISTTNHQITDQFRQYIKQHRTKLDEYLLNQLSTTNNNDYQIIITKSLDLITERLDMKNFQKLNKILQKEYVNHRLSKKISPTINLLKQTANKIEQGLIHFDNHHQSNSRIDQPTNCKIISPNPLSSPSSSLPLEPGIVLKEALEKARILFYKGKQAGIFANPNGGYDVRIIDDNDDALKQDSNLLRSIIVTEVKMCPKVTMTPRTFHVASPPPPTTKLLDENQIGEEFRRSIDNALKGLEAIYHQPVESKSMGAVETSENFSTSTELNNNNNKTLADSHSLPTSVPINSLVKSPSHNVQYTEIIHSESRDGEQSRRFITESYDDLPTQEDERTTSLKVVTKSEFSNRPDSREKVMEQSVQIITVKVRNETTTTTSTN